MLMEGFFVPFKNACSCEFPQDKKVWYVSKSYKLKHDVFEAFAQACDAAGVSQASRITKMMLEFIEKTEAVK